MIQVKINNEVAMEFESWAEFNEAFPNGITEPNCTVIDTELDWGLPQGHNDTAYDKMKINSVIPKF
jgi:hypothetical protein